MSKELNLIDTLIDHTAELVVQPELITLDDLSLTLVGGGQAGILF